MDLAKGGCDGRGGKGRDGAAEWGEMRRAVVRSGGMQRDGASCWAEDTLRREHYDRGRLVRVLWREY